MKKKVSFIDTKPKQMMNINMKVNVKVTNGTFSKKAKKNPCNLVIFWNKIL